MEDGTSVILGIFLIALAVWFHYDHKKLKEENNQLQQQNEQLETTLSTREVCLSEIDESIDEAKMQAWIDYDTMGVTLENLEDSSEKCYLPTY